MSKYRINDGPFFWVTDSQVATVVIKTEQLVLSQFKNFKGSQLRLLNKVIPPKIISKRYELVKLRHINHTINRSGPIFLRQAVLLLLLLLLLLLWRNASPAYWKYRRRFRHELLDKEETQLLIGTAWRVTRKSWPWLWSWRSKVAPGSEWGAVTCSPGQSASLPAGIPVQPPGAHCNLTLWSARCGLLRWRRWGLDKWADSVTAAAPRYREIAVDSWHRHSCL